ncbi:transporter [Lysobacteraceae bacterium NML120232]|nr:transporter [Xanthomonadaceae bacterium NML120232]
MQSKLRPRPAIASLCLLLTLPVTALAADVLDFQSARETMRRNSPQLAASRAGVESKRLQSQAMRNLGSPSLRLSAAAGRYHLHTDVALDGLNNLSDGLGNVLPIPLPSLPRLPDNATLERDGSYHSSALTALWPVYTGGLTHAVKGLTAAQHQESEADARHTAAQLDTLLIQRYFGLQLALYAAQLRDTALVAIDAHDHAAQRMMEEGLIARIERLQAQVALESARREALKARSDAELAHIALQRLLQQEAAITPGTALFVDTRPLPPLAHFQQQAASQHPGLAKVAALQMQAENMRAASASRLKPMVALYGMRQLQSGDRANWVAGVQASWTLAGGVNRRDMLAANTQRVAQAEYSLAQVREDIALLVEKNWRSAEDARQQYLATLPGVELARQMRHLHRSGLREGSSTARELMEAEAQFAKAETERAKAAHDYILALAALLESAGTPDQFGQYQQRADVRLPIPSASD